MPPFTELIPEMLKFEGRNRLVGNPLPVEPVVGARPSSSSFLDTITSHDGKVEHLRPRSSVTERPVTTAPSRPFALLLYFGGAYAWTWAFNLVKILAQRDIVSVPLPFLVLDIAAGLGPLVAALAVTSYEAGGAGRRALLRQLLRWRVPGRWYVIAILGPVVLTAVAFALWLVTGGSPPPAEALAQWALLPAFFVYVLLVGGGVNEELGWRGYALPRLQQRYGASIASVILGVAWAGWHIPAWFTPGSGQDAISFPVFVVSVTAAAILLTSLYNSTGGSLPVVILAHTVFDLCTTGPWSRALFTLPPDQSGLDPFNLLTIVVGILGVGVVLATDPRTLTGRRRWGFHGNSALQP